MMMQDVVSVVCYRKSRRTRFFFFFKQKTAYEVVSRDWSSDVCSSDLTNNVPRVVSVPGNQMWLAFASDASIQHEGFNVSYQFACK